MGWLFLTTHGLVLVAIAADPGQTMLSLAQTLNVSERTIQSVIRDLVADGYVTRTRIGRRNVYRIDRARHMRHPALERHEIAELLRALE